MFAFSLFLSAMCQALARALPQSPEKKGLHLQTVDSQNSGKVYKTPLKFASKIIHAGFPLNQIHGIHGMSLPLRKGPPLERLFVKPFGDVEDVKEAKDAKW